MSKDHDFVTEFIEIYRSFPCLWRKTDVQYHNTVKRDQAYNILLQKYKEYDTNATKKTVLSKINSLRSAFNKEYKKVKASERSGAATDEVYTPFLWYFNLLESLHENTSLGGNTSTITEESEDSETQTVSYVFTSSTFTYEVTKLPEQAIRKYDTSSLNCISIGGSTMDPNQILRLRKLLPNTYIALGYGTTGGYSVTHDFSKKKAYEEKVSSSGTVLAERELMFVNLETGKLLGPNQEGEIRVKSPYVMSGYYNFSKPDSVDEDGFLRVGDIGYYDDDKYVYVTDRISEMFKYRSTQVSPVLIENILLTHPNVAEALSFGVSHPVDRFHAAACVVLEDGIQVRVKELLDFVNDKVSDAYKLRAGIMMIDSIPKTPSGKVQRRSVRDLFRNLHQNNRGFDSEIIINGR